MFSVKDPAPVALRSNVVYKFTCASYNSCYVGETSRHLSTCIREHLNRDRTSHIFQHLQQSEACRNSRSVVCSIVHSFVTFGYFVRFLIYCAFVIYLCSALYYKFKCNFKLILLSTKDGRCTTETCLVNSNVSLLVTIIGNLLGVRNVQATQTMQNLGISRGFF